MVMLNCPDCGQPLDVAALRCPSGHPVTVNDGIILLTSGLFRNRLNTFLSRYDELYRKEQPAWFPEEHSQSPFVYSGPRKKEWAYRRRSLGVVKKIIRSKSALSILEIGPWNGWLSNQLSEAGHDVVAVDYFLEEPYGLMSHIHFPNKWTVIQADIGDLSIIASTYDMVIVNHCLQFQKDPECFCREVMDKLKPGGTLLVIGSPFFRNTRSKLKTQQKLLARYRDRYNFELYLVPNKGHLDANDLKGLKELGMTFYSYPGNYFQRLLNGLITTRPRYVYGILRKN